MKCTVSWLKEHLDTTASVEQIADTLTSIGLEVEEVVDKSKALAPFIVAHILEATQHPNADKLRVCKVDNGTEVLQIVCGAPNARAGIKVVLAPVGTYIPGSGITIKKSAIRSVESNGMLCSADELGLGGDSAGIVELAADAPVGRPFAETLGINDPMIDIAITPNRGDCLGVYGVARDLAAAGIGTLKSYTVPAVKGSYASPVTVRSENAEDCPLFIGRYFRGVKNTESPTWLKQRLEAIGLRPISALVDITNYIAYNFGRPLHVYDAKKLHGNLTVRRSHEGEAFAALNDKDYTLPAGLVVIADNAHVQAIGGVIGGRVSGCELDTTDVFLEVALFDPARVAESGRALDVHTDSRYRFERKVDPAFVQQAAAIASQMILELCGGEASELVIAGAEPAWQRSITFRTERVKTLGGVDVPAEKIRAILEAIGCKVSGNAVEIPSWRSDIEGEADLVEEVIRLYGFDKIPFAPLPAAPQSVAVMSQRQKATALARRELAARGLTEVVTWSFMDSTKAVLFAPVNEALRLLNPISSELDVMRPSILPNLIEAVKRNANRGYADIALFEVGNAYRDARPGQGQDRMIAGLRSGLAIGKSHYHTSRDVDVYDVKADAGVVLATVGLAIDNVQISTDAPGWYHPGRSGVLRLGKNVIGYFGELHPSLVQHYGVETTLVAFEIFLDALPEPKQKKSTAKSAVQLSDFQAVNRDFAFVVDQVTPVETIIRAIQKADKQFIDKVNVFDIYTGKGVEEGKKSVAVSVRLQPKDKTLTDQEIEAVSKAIIEAVQQQAKAVLRG